MTGSKAAGTNPRALGTNPRARGTNPRSVDVLATADLTPDELKTLAGESYGLYRRTKHWLTTRREAKKRANNCCERCGSTRQLDVHHRSYERLGEELETDLEVLCRACHGAEHKLLTTSGNTWLRDPEGRILGQVIEVVIELAPDIVLGEPLRRGVDLPLTTEDKNNNGDGGLEEEPIAAELLQQLPQFRFDELKANHLIGRAIDLVWDHYVMVMEPRSPKHGIEEERLIRDILKVATPEECLRAIEGCKASPFHMGRNDRGKKYNRLSQILKGKRGGKTAREQIDMFLDYADAAAAPAIGISPGRVKHLKDAIATYVQTGAERERAERARTTLVEAGVYSQIDFIPAEQRANYILP